MDFEIATRVPLSLKGPDNATEDMRKKAGLMADATKALLRGLGMKLKHQIIHARSIQAFRSFLLQPEAVGYERGMQVMLHPLLMGERSHQWRCRPKI